MKRVFIETYVPDNYKEIIAENGELHFLKNVQNIYEPEDISSIFISELIKEGFESLEETFGEYECKDKCGNYVANTINENSLLKDDIDSIKGTIGQLIDEYYELEEERCCDGK